MARRSTSCATMASMTAALSSGARLRRHRQRFWPARNERHRSRPVAGPDARLRSPGPTEIWNIPISDQVTSPSMRRSRSRAMAWSEARTPRAPHRTSRQGALGVARHRVFLRACSCPRGRRSAREPVPARPCHGQSASRRPAAAARPAPCQEPRSPRRGRAHLSPDSMAPL